MWLVLHTTGLFSGSLGPVSASMLQQGDQDIRPTSLSPYTSVFCAYLWTLAHHFFNSG